MKVSAVTNEDGRLCAQLINFIKAGRWDLNGSEAEELVKVKTWVSQLAGLMASDLRPSQAPTKPVETPAEGFRVKSLGSLPTKTKRKK